MGLNLSLNFSSVVGKSVCVSYNGIKMLWFIRSETYKNGTVVSLLSQPEISRLMMRFNLKGMKMFNLVNQ